MPPRVHILSLDIYKEAYDGPERRCLTAAATESKLRGHRRRQHLRAGDGAYHRLHIWAPQMSTSKSNKAGKHYLCLKQPLQKFFKPSPQSEFDFNTDWVKLC